MSTFMQKPYSAVLLVLSLLLLSVLLVACHTPRDREKEAIEVMSSNAQFDYTLLTLLRSNQTEKATQMLEFRTFLGLKDIWRSAGNDGIQSDQLCNQTFQDIYPIMRGQISLDRFHNLPTSEQIEITNFVIHADPLFLR
jgi:hypothetical protein